MYLRLSCLPRRLHFLPQSHILLKTIFVDLNSTKWDNSFFKFKLNIYVFLSINSYEYENILILLVDLPCNENNRKIIRPKDITILGVDIFLFSREPFPNRLQIYLMYLVVGLVFCADLFAVRIQICHSCINIQVLLLIFYMYLPTLFVYKTFDFI